MDLIKKKLELTPEPGQFDDAICDSNGNEMPKATVVVEVAPEVEQPQEQVDIEENNEQFDSYSTLECELLRNTVDDITLNSNMKHYQPLLKKVAGNKINLGCYEKSGKEIKSDKFFRNKDKADRATVENVLDNRTKIILFKWINDRKWIQELNGVISTGKEANVYHATCVDGDRAVKIYKTSILTFKDRDRYITGEFRRRNGYSKKNPRKMVAVWAEKEAKNLSRMHNCGLRVPKMYTLKGHVLVMEFIGTDGWAAPLLKDVNLSEKQFRKLYLECVHIVRTIYQVCKLVHADLSEFNLLFHQGKIVVIDVSQSVEHDHPHALDFLRIDCHNVNDFFKRKNVSVLSLKELFDFVTDTSITEQNKDERIAELMKTAVERMEDPNFDHKAFEAEQEVFRNLFVARDLHQVENCMEDQILSGVVVTKKDTEEEEVDDDENDDDELSDGAEVVESKVKKVVKSGRQMTKEERKEHKKEAKEEAREKRTRKLPKHVKKRSERKGHAKR